MSSKQILSVVLLCFLSSSAYANNVCTVLETYSNELALQRYSVAWLTPQKNTQVCNGANVQDSTKFEAASLSKPIFAAIVMTLVEKGELSLNDKIHSLLPEQDAPKRFQHLYTLNQFKLLTVKHILSHRSGLPNWRGSQKNLSFANKPGEKFSYSGEAFELLQATVEFTQDEQLEALARKYVFKPLNMLSTSYLSLPNQVIVGTNNVGRPYPSSHNIQGSAAFSLVTTASDYLTFMQALASNKLLSKSTWETMVKTASTESDDSGASINWGLGVMIGSANKQPYFLHTGSNPGFRALAIMHLNGESGFVYLSASDRGSTMDQWLTSTLLAMQNSSDIHTWLECNDCELNSRFISAVLGFKDINKFPNIELEQKTDVAYAFAEAGNIAAAKCIYSAVKKLQPDYIELMYGDAVIALQRGDYSASKQRLTALLQKNPDATNAKSILQGIESMDQKNGRRFFLSGHENASVVFLRGDMNGWQRFSLPMKKVAGGWERYVPEKEYARRYFFQVGNRWVLDPNAANTERVFGKVVSKG